VVENKLVRRIKIPPFLFGVEFKVEFWSKKWLLSDFHQLSSQQSKLEQFMFMY